MAAAASIEPRAEVYSAGKGRGFRVAARRHLREPRVTPTRSCDGGELTVGRFAETAMESRAKAHLLKGVYNASVEALQYIKSRDDQVAFRAVFGYFLGTTLVDALLAGPCARFRDAPHEFQEQGPCIHCGAGRPA